MNKSKVIKLLELLNDDMFVNEVDSCFNDSYNKSDKSLSKILDLSDEKIDSILKTNDFKKKAYKFYLYVYDKNFNDESKDKINKVLDCDEFPSFLLSYLKQFSDNISDNEIDNQVKAINKAISDENFRKEIFKVITNENLSFLKIKDIIISLSNIVLEESMKDVRFVLDNDNFSKRYDIAKIIDTLTKTDSEINLELVTDFLKEDGIEDFEYLNSILHYISSSSFPKALIIFQLFKNSDVRNIWLSCEIAESIARANSFEVAKVTGNLALNKALQKSDKYRDIIKIISKCKNEQFSTNGKILIEYLIKNDLLDKVDCIKLLRGVSLIDNEEISNLTLNAALDKQLLQNKYYEDIVFDLGSQNNDIELANNGFEIVRDLNFVERPDLLYIINCVSLDGDKNKKNNAFEIAKRSDLQNKRCFDDLLDAVAHSYTQEQSDLAFKYVMDENNKDLYNLGTIATLIGKGKTFLHSKVIYDLGYNKNVINLEENGLEIMNDIFMADSKSEIKYILSNKYDVKNLGNMLKLSNVFEKDHNTIIKFLNDLEDVDINKNTKIRKRRK